jgi:hypothetical protein
MRVLSVHALLCSAVSSYKQLLCQSGEQLLAHFAALNPGHGYFLIPPAYSSDRR